MNDTPWFHDRSVDELHERCYWRRVGFGVFLALVVLMILGPFLAGCAANPEKKAEPKLAICYMKLMGQTDSGVTVVMQACQSPEAFAESQK